MSEYLIQEDTLALLAENIKNKTGLNKPLSLQDMILAINGLNIGVDTSDATASPAEIAEGYTAYVNGVKLTGEGEILASAGTTLENFLVQNPGYFDECFTNEYTFGNNMTLEVQTAFSFSINSLVKLNGGNYKDTNWDSFEDYGILVFQDNQNILEGADITSLELLENFGVVVYQKKDMSFYTVKNSTAIRVTLRDLWLDQCKEYIYAAPFIKIDGKIHIRQGNAYKLQGYYKGLEQLKTNSGATEKRINYCNALMDTIDAYSILFPKTTTFKFDKSQLISNDTEIEE